MLYRLYNATHPKVIAAVRELLRPDEETIIIGQALELLANRQDKEALAAAEKLLKDADRSSVRAMAAAWLLRMGVTERAADLARELREGGIDVNEFFRVKNLLWPMQRLSEEVLDAVVEMLEKSEDNVSVLQSAVELIAKYRHRKAIPLLKRLLNHENRQVAKAAFEGLAGLSGALDPETLLPMLVAEDLDRRLWAADALRRMDDPSGLAPVIEILKSGTQTQRIDAARILGGFRAQAAVEPLLAAMLDEDLSVRVNAGNSLQTVFSAIFPYRRLDFATVGWTYNAPPDVRAAAVAKIREWWTQARTKTW
jgi:HEAT repeat protein